MVTNSTHLAPRDGIKLAATVMLPKGLPAGIRIPVTGTLVKCGRNRVHPSYLDLPIARR